MKFKFMKKGAAAGGASCEQRGIVSAIWRFNGAILSLKLVQVSRRVNIQVKTAVMPTV